MGTLHFIGPHLLENENNVTVIVTRKRTLFYAKTTWFGLD